MINLFLLGSYVYVYNRTQSRGSAVNGHLFSTRLQSKITTDCLSFYYYIHGEGVGQINLVILQGGESEEIIWSRKYSAGDKWHLYKINIGPQKSAYQVQSKIFVNTFA